MKAYVLIKLQTGEIVEALHQLRRLKGVVSADMTFGPYDAVATIEAPDLKSVGQVVAADIQP
ncbi:MAG TPA: Lrp/AsnC ligand binding domain-containing protein, partial [Anaerolineales bacterium]|nr:Lrp/AsnC ligand binding domain-containing protein [Anaerolineales bacterium]